MPPVPCTSAAFKEKSLEVATALLTENSPRTQGQMLKNIRFYLLVGQTEKAAKILEGLQGLVDNGMVSHQQVLDEIKVLTDQMKTQQ